MHRRHFLMSATAASAASLAPAWADIGGPMFLTAASLADRSTWLVGLTQGGEVRFAHPIPGRGHAAATHPARAEAVAFARRPGRFALVIDCATGTEIARLTPPEDRHFYGHGAFTADGRYLFTTENAFDIPDGRLGIWDAEAGYARMGEVPSGGIGPHEIIRLADGRFAVANGGIQTHPDFNRAKLNLATMQTNLSWLSATGTIEETIAFEGEMRQNSIRHIDSDGHGAVLAALQWQGDPTRAVPVAARFAQGGVPEFFHHPDDTSLKHYAGSIAVTAEGTEVAVTGPKGNSVLFMSVAGTPGAHRALSVASGVAQAPDGFLITYAGGIARGRGGALSTIPVAGGWSWDNHLVRIA